ncbi:MAG: hypothetical protein L0H53_02175 [Candidatus Nitrosocosmicus sp.]|nr:hypothetical protein [Candidatus Nitrosocosmicus sp.]MDN5866988.1 hypothetical protein [Candidatus Nitrosocosmicus sp.]
MINVNNYTNTKLNKHFDSSEIKLIELHRLLQEFFVVNLFEVTHIGMIKNILIQQVMNPNSTITIGISYFEENKRILYLMQQLTEEARVESIRIALQKSFKIDLNNRLITIDYSDSTFIQGGRSCEI